MKRLLIVIVSLLISSATMPMQNQPRDTWTWADCLNCMEWFCKCCPNQNAVAPDAQPAGGPAQQQMPAVAPSLLRQGSEGQAAAPRLPIRTIASSAQQAQRKLDAQQVAAAQAQAAQAAKIPRFNILMPGDVPQWLHEAILFFDRADFETNAHAQNTVRNIANQHDDLLHQMLQCGNPAAYKALRVFIAQERPALIARPGNPLEQQLAAPGVPSSKPMTRSISHDTGMAAAALPGAPDMMDEQDCAYLAAKFVVSNMDPDIWDIVSKMDIYYRKPDKEELLADFIEFFKDNDKAALLRQQNPMAHSRLTRLVASALMGQSMAPHSHAHDFGLDIARQAMRQGAALHIHIHEAPKVSHHRSDSEQEAALAALMIPITKAPSVSEQRFRKVGETPQSPLQLENRFPAPKKAKKLKEQRRPSSDEGLPSRSVADVLRTKTTHLAMIQDTYAVLQEKHRQQDEARRKALSDKDSSSPSPLVHAQQNFDELVQGSPHSTTAIGVIREFEDKTKKITQERKRVLEKNALQFHKTQLQRAAFNILKQQHNLNKSQSKPA